MKVREGVPSLLSSLKYIPATYCGHYVYCICMQYSDIIYADMICICKYIDGEDTPLGGMFFEIYQLEDTETDRYKNLPDEQAVVDLNCYVLVGTGHLSFEDEDIKPEAVLDELLRTFNLKKPRDFKGREISESDIIILNGEAAFYCQDFCWRPIEVINRKDTQEGGTSQ